MPKFPKQIRDTSGQPRPLGVLARMARAAKEFLQKHTAWALIAVGIALLIGWVFVPDFAWGLLTSERVRSFMATGGVALLGSGVFSAVIKSELIISTFRDAVLDVLYGDQHLRTRSDLKEVWVRVSMALSEQNFHDIAGRVLEEMRLQYLENPKSYYVRDFWWKLTVVWADPQERRHVLLTNRFEYTIVTGDPALRIDLRPRVLIPKTRAEWGEEKTTVFTVDGVNRLSEWQDLKYDSVPIGRHGTWHTYWDRLLEGKTEYELLREQTRKVELAADSIVRQVSSNVVDRPVVEVIVDTEDLAAEFYPIGTPREWNPAPDHGRTSNLYMKYPGVVFPNQGFMVVLKSKSMPPNLGQAGQRADSGAP